MKKSISKHIWSNRLLVLLAIGLCGLFGCKKSVTVDSPANSISSATVYNEDFTAASVLSGIYSTMSNTFQSDGITKIGFLAGLSADEFTLFNTSNSLYRLTYYNQLSPAPSSDSQKWGNTYALVYRCNAAITGLTASTKLTPEVKQQLLGEAKFCRAFFYFYLTNLYGDVPLALSTDYKVNSVLSRAKSADVYKQIISDLIEAQTAMSENYVGNSGSGTSTERVRPTKGAATAMLARTYLYLKDYVNAEKQASSLLENKTLYDTVSLDEVFLKNSMETIWSLQPVIIGNNTDDAKLYVLPDNGPNPIYPAYLSASLMNAFEPDDKRKTLWTGNVTTGGKTYDYAFKYKAYQTNQPVTEYTMVLRLAEQYLIRSEARANLGKLQDAIDDLNVIRRRAGLNDSNASSRTEILAAIEKERQVELFSEWGHRWLDLKRTGRIDAVMQVVAPIKGSTWRSQMQLYPIPNDERILNDHLTQNDGY